MSSLRVVLRMVPGDVVAVEEGELVWMRVRVWERVRVGVWAGWCEGEPAGER